MLKKELGVWHVFSIAAGAMISSGLFVLPGIAFRYAGPAMILSYALASVMMVPTMLAKAELATAMPKSGGAYFFIERSMGALMGTVAGLTGWAAIALKATFALVGIGALGSLLLPGIGIWGIKVVAVAWCIFFAVLNAASVKGAGRFQVGLVIALLGILGLYAVFGLPETTHARYGPFIPHGAGSVFAVAGMVFVSFGGLTKVVAVSEEVRDPGRSIPRGMLAAFFVVSVLYILTVFVTVGVVDGEALEGSLTPISLGARTTMGLWGALVVGAGALMAFMTTGNAGVLAASRSPMAMSADGLLPKFFMKTNKRFGTPHVSIAVTAGLMIAVIVFLPVEDLVKTASAMMVLMFILVNLAVIVMRQSGLRNYRPLFKAPGYPWLQLAAIPLYAFIILEMGLVPLILTGGFTLLAAGWYALYVHRRIDRESAVVYLVKSIVSRHVRRTGLEDELRQIALQRDQVTPDRFDKLVRSCPVLDIKEKVVARDLFRRLAQLLSPRLDMEPQKVYELFLEREKEASTVIQPGLAIPHIVVEGKDIFEIALVRCADGVVFSELHAPVRTAFVLIGSQDERNFHLKALMAIAHIVQESDFEKRWFEAKNLEQLRDVVLLSRRQRVAESGGSGASH